MNELFPGTAQEKNKQISGAEDVFLLMARSPEFYGFLGRCGDASDEELRSIFGLAVAAIRRSGLAARPEYGAAALTLESTVGMSRAALESRLREMSEALARREAQISELRSRLKLGDDHPRDTERREQ